MNGPRPTATQLVHRRGIKADARARNALACKLLALLETQGVLSKGPGSACPQVYSALPGKSLEVLQANPVVR